MKRDADQQAAINVRANAVVSAGAGSGKTSVLTSRYLRLVTDEQIPVSEILALTFTRKAAAEMYERIYAALAERSDDAFVARQLAGFDAATISTLDSFCAAIARNGCSRFGVPSTFMVDEQSLRSRCEALALSFLTAHADEPVVADLIRLNGFARLWKEGLARLALDHFRVSDATPLDAYLPEQERFLRGELDRLQGELERLLDAIAGLAPDGPKCIQGAREIVAEFDRHAAFAATEADRGTAEFARLDAISLRYGTSKHADVPLFKELVGELKAARDRYELAMQTLSRWDEHVKLTHLIEAFRLRVVGEKRRLAILSYNDVTGLAIRALAEDLALRDYYKARFRAIMIDEFQDNNEEQKALLYLISEKADAHSPGVPPASALDPGKLFFVGDEKQSIYRFRGADVSVFRTLAGELSGPQADLRLGANYRSEPGLIDFFNALFTKVFANAREEYEARFEPLRSRAASPGVSPRVELWELEQRPSRDETFVEDTDAEAYHIASFIRSAVEDGSLPVGNGVAEDGERAAGRPARYGDFAVLMRSSSNQIRLERTLRLFGVPYTSQAARSLFLEAPVNDIYQALQLVLYPDDRTAYAGYLRSPLVGVSDEGIVRLMLSESALLEPCVGLSDDDRRRVELGRDRYRELCDRADSLPITELLHHIWYRWGYRYHLLRRSEYIPYLEYYDHFWELAHSFEERGLAAFLDEVRGHIGRNEKLDELETLRGDEGGVQIMTIHKSKGLEFPVVIVANAGNRGRSDTVSGTPYYWSPARGLAFNTGTLPDGAVREKAANYLYSYELDEHQAQELAETKRLLYVAATRAESHLVFSGIPRENERSLMGILQPGFVGAQEELAGGAGGAPVAADAARAPAVTVRALEPVTVEQEQRAHRAGGRREISELASRYAGLPVVDRRYPQLEFTATALNQRAPDPGPGSHVLASPEHPIDAVLAEYDLATVFGSYCHWCIEHAASLPADRPPDAAVLPAALRPELRRDAPGAADIRTFYQYGYELALGFLRSPTGARIASATVEHEIAFLLHADALPPDLRSAEPHLELVRGQIDLLAEFDDHVLVVDFKTDRLLDPAHYRVQLAIYAAAARELSAKPSRVELYHLRSATAVPVTS